MVIFHSYVKLPEGNTCRSSNCHRLSIVKTCLPLKTLCHLTFSIGSSVCKPSPAESQVGAESCRKKTETNFGIPNASECCISSGSFPKYPKITYIKSPSSKITSGFVSGFPHFGPPIWSIWMSQEIPGDGLSWPLEVKEKRRVQATGEGWKSLERKGHHQRSNMRPVVPGRYHIHMYYLLHIT